MSQPFSGESVGRLEPKRSCFARSSIVYNIHSSNGRFVPAGGKQFGQMGRLTNERSLDPGGAQV